MAKKKKRTWLNKILHRCLGIVLAAGSIFLIFSVLFFHAGDSALNFSSGEPVRNYLGRGGACAADWLLTVWGPLSVCFLIVPLLWGYNELRLREFINPYTRVAAWLLGLCSAVVFMALLPLPRVEFFYGGIVGEKLVRQLMSFANGFGFAYAGIVLGAVLFGFAVICFDYAAGITVKDWWRWGKTTVLAIVRTAKTVWRYVSGGMIRIAERLRECRHKDETGDGVVESDDKPLKKKKTKAKKKAKNMKAEAGSKDEALPRPGKAAAKADDGYRFPDVSLLSRPADKGGNKISEKELEEISHELEGVLEEFGVHGHIVKVRPGPVVTLYELEPAPGTKTARVIGLADDIARSMSAVSVRIAVVPGSNTIGIELPNKNRETVWLHDLLEDEQFRNSKNELNVVLGKDIGGRNVYADLAKMPHLLVAGTTGSGKSVGVNSMILSLLFRMRPDECKLIMIDPKMLEFSMYNGIPHLLTPVITDPAKAVVGLKWAVREMEDRYRAMAQLNVRNIMGYNQKLRELKASGEVIKRTVQTGFDAETGKPIYEEQELDLTPLPYIVIVVDEMADLMLVAGKEVEAAIQRLAQMARAAGLHLIMSTQRPSVDVITGTIKANFPTRISYQVTSKIDSRTILGEQGAEQLLGRGDMLYMPAGQRPQRVHGGFAPDAEIEKVVDFIKTQKAPEYVEGVTEGELNTDKSSGGGAVFDKGDMGGGSDEDLYLKAVEIVRADKKASTSYIQRRLRIGYNRAASLIDRMEEEGVVSAPDHAGRREVL